MGEPSNVDIKVQGYCIDHCTFLLGPKGSNSRRLLPEERGTKGGGGHRREREIVSKRKGRGLLSCA